MSVQRKQAIRDSALDSCGIGHNVQEKFNEGSKAIGKATADLSEACQNQLTHNLLTNAPCGIDVGDPIKNAIDNGIASFVGAYVKWDIDQARRIAALILQDVNDHETASMLFTLAAIPA